jgi:hypothetical protein
MHRDGSHGSHCAHGSHGHTHDTHGAHSGNLWIPITYGDFWDVPRTILVKFSDKTIFFDCAFDDDLDDYPEAYKVYELDNEVAAYVKDYAWTEMAKHGKLIGTLPVAKIQLDSSKRQSINAAVFGHLVPAE